MKLAADPPPPNIPDYALLRRVGSGSYGDVWLARSVTGHYRAVKIVWRDRFSELPPYEREFKGLREFAAVSLTEPHQLALLHVGRNDQEGYFYYVMELADDVTSGRDIDPAHYTPHTLRERRERQGRLSTGQVFSIGMALARALAGLHSRGLVHRDVKPSNVIFVGGMPKLADIGLVSATTLASTFVGTEGFVPPEGPGSPSADVFGLGKLLYEMATGLDRHEFPRLPPDLHELLDHPDLLELNEILVKACASRVEQRYGNAMAMLSDLYLLQEGRSMRRLRLAEQRWSRTVRSVLAISLMLGLVGFGAYLERKFVQHEITHRRNIETERDELARNTDYAASLAAAQAALNQQDLESAQSELRRFIPVTATSADLRGPRWHQLWHQVSEKARLANRYEPKPAL